MTGRGRRMPWLWFERRRRGVRKGRALAATAAAAKEKKNVVDFVPRPGPKTKSRQNPHQTENLHYLSIYLSIYLIITTMSLSFPFRGKEKNIKPPLF